jgi:hypothetical protein
MPTGPVRGTGLDGGANGQSAAHVTAGGGRRILGVTVHQRNKARMQSCVKRGLLTNLLRTRTCKRAFA